MDDCEAGTALDQHVVAEEARAFAAWHDAWTAAEELRRVAVVSGGARAWQDWEVACAAGERARQEWAHTERVRRAHAARRKGSSAAQ